MGEPRDRRLSGAVVVVAILFTGGLYLLTRESTAIQAPGSAVYGVLFLVGVVMLATGRLQLPGGLQVTGRRARAMGLAWVLPLLVNFALPRLGGGLAALAGPVTSAALLAALGVSVVVLALVFRAG